MCFKYFINILYYVYLILCLFSFIIFQVKEAAFLMVSSVLPSYCISELFTFIQILNFEFFVFINIYSIPAGMVERSKQWGSVTGLTWSSWYKIEIYTFLLDTFSYVFIDLLVKWVRDVLILNETNEYSICLIKWNCILCCSNIPVFIHFTIVWLTQVLSIVFILGICECSSTSLYWNIRSIQ